MQLPWKRLVEAPARAHIPPIEQGDAVIARDCVRALADLGEEAFVLYARESCTQMLPDTPGVLPLPVSDVDLCVAMVADLAERGAAGVVLPLFQHVPSRYDNPVYEPLWAALAGADLPVVFHRGALRTVSPDPMPFDLALHRVGNDDPMADDLIEVLGVSYARMALLSLVYSGVFARHPSLKVVVSGFGSLWVPYALARMDLQYQFRPERAGGDTEGDDKEAVGLATERRGFTFPEGTMPSDHIKTNVWVASAKPSDELQRLMPGQWVPMMGPGES